MMLSLFFTVGRQPLLRKPFPVKFLLPNVEAILVYHIMEEILEIFNIMLFCEKALFLSSHTPIETKFKASRLLILSILLYVHLAL